ncbi:MAG: MoaD/ThiS family protein [Thermodesulfobacteriota bacterium]
MPSVRIPTPLRRLTGDKDEVTINAKNIRELIEGLEKQFPGVKERLCDESGNVRRFINLYVNNEDIRFLKGIETELKESDIVSIIPAIAGGTEKAILATNEHK